MWAAKQIAKTYESKLGPGKNRPCLNQCSITLFGAEKDPPILKTDSKLIIYL